MHGVALIWAWSYILHSFKNARMPDTVLMSPVLSNTILPTYQPDLNTRWPNFYIGLGK